jgi:hypothetical protein
MWTLVDFPIWKSLSPDIPGNSRLEQAFISSTAAFQSVQLLRNAGGYIEQGIDIIGLRLIHGTFLKLFPLVA